MKVQIDGTGEDVETPLTYSTAPTIGVAYQFTGSIIVRSTTGVRCCTVHLFGAVVRRTGTSTWQLEAKPNLVLDSAETIGSFFDRAGDAYSAVELPGLGIDGGLTHVVPLKTGVSATVELRAELKPLGHEF